MIPTVTGHQWSEETLFCKARLYAEQMEKFTINDWQFGLWSALSLELLTRAALAHISPVLLADTQKNWRNLTHVLGKSPTLQKFSPTSLSTGGVIDRLAELVPTFSSEICGFCKEHADRRNTELHSGELSFEEVEITEWLPKFYFACKVLLESMDRNLAELISDPVAAEDLINSLQKDAKITVWKEIEAHKKVWSNKNDSEMKIAYAGSIAWAIRHTGHRVKCPACASNALLQGTLSGPVTTEIEMGNVIQRQATIPSSFECIACGLRISGLSKLSACNLGDAFHEKSTYSPAEFFELYTEEELEEARSGEPDFEPDFNEY